MTAPNSPRVHVAHVEAVAAAMPDALAALVADPVDGKWAFAELIAAAVIAAHDDEPPWVVITRSPSGTVTVYGPYPSGDHARAAVEGSHVFADQPGVRGGIWPVVPAPRIPKRAVPAGRPKKKKAAPAIEAQQLMDLTGDTESTDEPNGNPEESTT